MGLRFRKSIKLGKGVRLNLGTKGVSVSAGVKGARFSMHSSGRKTATFSLPGTGLSYVKTFGGKKKSKKDSDKKASSRKSTASNELSAKEVRANEKEYAEFQEYLAALHSVHKECDTPVDWIGLYQAAPPVQGGSRVSKVLEEWQETHDFAEKVIRGDIDSYLAVIEEAKPFEDLTDFGSDFEYGTEDPRIMEIEFCVKSDEVIPTEELILNEDGSLKEKAFTKTAYYDLVQDYVCSTAIRLARELFAALPVEEVLVHAVDQIVNTATGRDEECTLLSVRFLRTGFMDINFDRIDPSDFVCSFENHMKFLKTKGFQPVEPLE